MASSGTDDGVVFRVSRAYNVPVTLDDNSGLVETELRDLADHEAAQIDPEMFDQMARAATAHPVTEVFSDMVSRTWEMAPNQMRPDVREIRDRYLRAGQLDPLQGASDEVVGALLRMVLFLVWADEHADDGYRDPRVRDPKEPRH